MTYEIVTKLNEQESALVNQMAQLAGIPSDKVSKWIENRFLEELFKYAKTYIADKTMQAAMEQANAEASVLVAGIEALEAARFPAENEGSSE